jgi:hypothetical protein
MLRDGRQKMPNSISLPKNVLLMGKSVYYWSIVFYSCIIVEFLFCTAVMYSSLVSSIVQLKHVCLLLDV